MRNINDVIPPQAIDIEQIVIGSIIYEADCFETVLGIINVDCFYEKNHKTIFNACNELLKTKKPIDLLTVKNKLQESNELESIGGVYALTNYTSRIGSTANIEYHARIVLEKYMRREIIRIGHEVAKRAHQEDDDIFELIDEARTLIDCIDNISSSEVTFKKIDALVKERREKLKELTNSPNPISGISTGYKSWDAFSGGLHAPDLIIVAGRPGMGKTLVGRNLISNIAETLNFDECVVVFALEEGNLQYAENVIAAESHIEKDRIKRLQLTELDFSQMEHQLKKFEGKNYFIDDTSGITIQAIERKCRKISKKFKIKAILIDYIQLCTTSSKHGNREQEISEISRNTKGIAKKFNCPVIALAQLSREVEKTSNKRPMLSHLRESGCLTGDTLIFVPSLKKLIKIEDLVNEGKFNVFGTDYINNKIADAKKCFKSGTKDVFELTLSNFQKISATANHKFLTFNGWKALGDLTKEDNIAIPINYGDCEDDYLEEEISLIGHFLSNGSALPNQPIRYTCNILDVDLAEQVMSDALIASNYKIAPYWKDDIRESNSSKTVYFKPTFHLTHGKTSPIGDIMKKYGLWDKRAKDKFIPEELFFVSHKKTCILLKSLFSGDGTVFYYEKRGRKSLKISYSSSSERLIKDIQLLLAKVGIVSFVNKLTNKKNQTWYNLYIAGKLNIELYVKNIGFWNKRKNDILLNGWERSKNNLAGWTKCKYNENRTLCFLPIKNIESVGAKNVYDIEVPKLHNFVANGMIVHNSIEQDADIVIFPWRPEYYDFTEYFGDKEYTNTKDLIIIEYAKHRNGQLGEFPMSVNLRTNLLLDYKENTDWVNSVDFSTPRSKDEMNDFDNFVF